MEPVKFAVCLLLLLAGCSSTTSRKAESGPEGMVWIPGGNFTMGSDAGRPDEKPQHEVELAGFWMDKTEVTNAQFARFVEATNYVTVAERKPDPQAFPGVAAEKLVPGALVFAEGEGWQFVPGADWRHPEGPGSTIKGREKHPAVQVAWEDAAAYAKWAGKSLPTEAQYEFAARGGLDAAKYSWGIEPPSDEKPQANFWQGEFPLKNSNTDGFARTAPVGSFASNGYGLNDISGNVWEWCRDWYRSDAYQTARKVDPQGPRDSRDPDEPKVAKRVVRGGSYLCAECYCQGYRLTARMKSSPDTGLCHTGFRCVINGK